MHKIESGLDVVKSGVVVVSLPLIAICVRLCRSLRRMLKEDKAKQAFRLSTKKRQSMSTTTQPKKPPFSTLLLDSANWSRG